MSVYTVPENDTCVKRDNSVILHVEANFAVYSSEIRELLLYERIFFNNVCISVQLEHEISINRSSPDSNVNMAPSLSATCSLLCPLRMST